MVRTFQALVLLFRQIVCASSLWETARHWKHQRHLFQTRLRLRRTFRTVQVRVYSRLPSSSFATHSSNVILSPKQSKFAPLNDPHRAVFFADIAVCIQYYCLPCFAHIISCFFIFVKLTNLRLLSFHSGLHKLVEQPKSLPGLYTARNPLRVSQTIGISVQ